MELRFLLFVLQAVCIGSHILEVTGLLGLILGGSYGAFVIALVVLSYSQLTAMV